MKSSAQRILFVASETYHTGGIQRFNRTFLSACKRLNVECEVLSLLDTSAAIARGPGLSNVRVTGFAGRRLAFAGATLRAVASRRFDVVIIGHINFLSMVAAATSFVPRHPQLVLVGHGIEVWNGVRSLRRLAMRSVSKVLCVSQYTKERMEQQAPFIARERFVVFHNALSEEWTAKAMELAAASNDVRRSSALDAASSKNYILSVTRLDKGDRYKGIVTVLEAFAMLRDRSLRYVVVGQGNDLPFLQSVAARCGVADRVDFLGTLPDTDLVSLYRGCKAFVLPSGKEGFGIVFLEAMFFSAPVIAAHEKGARDVVTDGENGLTVAYGDVIGLHDALVRLLADESLANRLRSNGQRCVTGNGPFTFDQFTRRCAQALSLSSAS